MRSYKTLTAILAALLLTPLIYATPLSRALSISALLAKKYATYQLTDLFYQAFDTPEINSVWFIYAASTSGKTTFVWQLIKELAPNARILYNSLEEGEKLTLQKTVRRVGMPPALRRKVIIVRESLAQVTDRLNRQKAPGIIIIDSWQYTMANFSEYVAFKAACEGRTLIVVSQTEGRKPAGRTAERIRFDADLKIWVEGFRAFSQGRYIGPLGHYDIWPEGAAKHWGGTTPTETQTPNKQ